MRDGWRRRVEAERGQSAQQPTTTARRSRKSPGKEKRRSGALAGGALAEAAGAAGHHEGLALDLHDLLCRGRYEKTDEKPENCGPVAVAMRNFLASF